MFHDRVAKMSHRVVEGLWLARPCDRPKSIPHGRARGAKAQGLRYERGLAKALSSWQHGQWFEFRDRNGPGWCQPDFIRLDLANVAVLECKYTWTTEGHSQIEQLYRPVLERALALPVIGVVVCKVLRPGMPKDIAVAPSLASALELAVGGRRVVWHWIGLGPLSAQPHLVPIDPASPGAHRAAMELL